MEKLDDNCNVPPSSLTWNKSEILQQGHLGVLVCVPPTRTQGLTSASTWESQRVEMWLPALMAALGSLYHHPQRDCRGASHGPCSGNICPRGVVPLPWGGSTRHSGADTECGQADTTCFTESSSEQHPQNPPVSP